MQELANQIDLLPVQYFYQLGTVKEQLVPTEFKYSARHAY